MAEIRCPSCGHDFLPAGTAALGVTAAAGMLALSMGALADGARRLRRSGRVRFGELPPAVELMLAGAGIVGSLVAGSRDLQALVAQRGQGPVTCPACGHRWSPAAQ